MRYSWDNPSSLIREVEIKTQGKRKEAFIYAPASAEPEKLRDLAGSLRAAGFAAVPDAVGDRYVLRIEQLESADALLETLATHRAVSGLPQIEKQETDQSKPTRFTDKFKQNTVKAAGYAYVLGDALMVASGLLRIKGLWGNPEERKGGINEMLTGVMWAVPNIGLIVYGKKNPDIQKGVLVRGLQSYLTEQGVELSAEDRQAFDKLARPESSANRMEEFLYDHPTQINNSIEALGGLKLLNAGRTQTIGFDTKPNYYKMGQGAFVFAGMAGSVVVQEKKKPAFQQAADAKNAQEEKGFVARQVDWFLEKPLRLAGWGAAVNNVLGLVGPAIYERKATQAFLAASEQGFAGKTAEEVNIKRVKARNYLGATGYNIGTSLAFLAANGMYSLGSKDTSVDLKSSGALDQVYALSAHVIAEHPKAHQAALVQQLAGYFSDKPDVHQSAAEIAHILDEKLRALARNPWTQRVQTAPAAMEAQPSL